MKRLLGVLLAGYMLGCAAATPGGSTSTKDGASRAVSAPVAAPPADEPKWIRYQTEHFDVATDLVEEEALRAAQTLEATRAAMLSAGWPGSPDTVGARTSIIVFADGFDYVHFFDKSAGIFVRLVRPTIVLWGKPDYWEQKTGLSAEASSSILRHELTHRIASSFFQHQPRWFSEGLAQYFETMTLSQDGAVATVGETFPDGLRGYKQHRLSVRDALAWKSHYDHDEETLRGLYGLSWLMVHFFFDHCPREFAAFQRALMRGVPTERAWTQAFGGTSIDTLDARLADYAQRRAFKKTVVPLESAAAATPPRRATITAADVHAIRAQLGISGMQSATRSYLREEVQKELRRAFTLEPGNPLAIRLLRAEGKHLPARELVGRLRQQITQRPDDGDAWLLLAELGESAEREAAARKAVALMPGSADAYADLAWHLATTGRADEAMTLMTKAISLAPWESRIFEIHATVLANASRCREAAQAQSRAIELSAEGAARSPHVQEMRRKLDDYKRSCSAKRRQ